MDRTTFIKIGKLAMDITECQEHDERLVYAAATLWEIYNKYGGTDREYNTND